MEEKVEMYAIVELFGHQKMAGLCTEQSIAGTNFLRVDVPETKTQPGFTRLLNHQAIYAINPVTKDVADVMAEQIAAKPITAWDIRAVNKKAKQLAQNNVESDEVPYPDNSDEYNEF